MTCPLTNTEYQQYCCLYDKHQQNNTFDQCEYQQACNLLKVNYHPTNVIVIQEYMRENINE
jgi:hypothetical protein